MTTVRDMLAQARHHLMTAKPDTLNQLAAGVAANAESLTMKHAVSGIGKGSILAIDLEEYYVTAVSGDTVSVIPGVNGSTSTAHTIDSLVYVTPNFSDFRIALYINDALEDLSGMGLFQMKQATFDYTPSQSGYVLTAPDMIDVWRVRYEVPGPSNRWPMLKKEDYYVDQDADTTDFPGGKQIVLKSGGSPGRPIRVSYKAGFTDLIDFSSFDPSTDYILEVTATTGLHREAHSLLPKMAAITLLAGREIKRTFLDRQPEPRRQEEVPVGGASQSMRPLLADIQEGLKTERRRLKRRYPEQVY